MDKRDNFEKKLKDKLEEVQTPYDESAWENFQSLLDSPKTPFWKQWYMPYLYSSVLFAIAMLYFNRSSDSDNQLSRMHQQVSKYRADTLVRKDTVYIIDTIYVYKQLYVMDNGSKYINNFNSGSVRGSNGIAGVANYNNGNVDSMNQGFLTSDPLLTQHSINDISQSNIDAAQVGDLTSTQSSDTLVSKKENYLEEVLDDLSEANMGIDSAAINTTDTAIEDLLVEVEREGGKTDTTVVQKEPKVKKSKPIINFEAGLSLLIPVSNNIDYYTSSVQAFNFGLEWESGFGLYIGVLRNNIRGEIDDDEISAFDPAALNAMPGRPDDISIIDEIYLSNRQWYFPLELRWRSSYYNGFSFESSVGVVGNYLVSQGFTYEFEDNLGLDDQSETLSIQQFKLSHVKIGVGTQYLLSDTWGMFMRSHYWFPMNGIGLFNNRVHGLEVGVGLKYFIGK
ncbi:MAG: hypothetical protein ACFCUU_04075 [Cyclobacteriaceae bacterium]